MASLLNSVLHGANRGCLQRCSPLTLRPFSTVGTGHTIQQLIKGRNGSLVSIDKNATVKEAAKLMNDNNIGCVMVMDGPKVYGIVTERDFLRRMVLLELDPVAAKIGDIATVDIVAVDQGDTVAHCMSVMNQEGLRHLPVVKNGAVVDMISIRDLVTAIHEGTATELKYLKEYLGFDAPDKRT